MPYKYTPEGATEEIEVYTAEELEAQRKAAAEQAAQEAREAARKELEADPNGIAAAARRDAEKRLKQAEKEHSARVAELEAALADTSKFAEQLKALQDELKAAREEKEKAAGEVETAKAAFARKTALIEAGAKPASVAKVEALLAADGVDMGDQEAVTKALDALKADAPGLFLDGKTGYRPNGGSDNPPKHGSHPTPEQVAQMTQAEYEAYRTGK